MVFFRLLEKEINFHNFSRFPIAKRSLYVEKTEDSSADLKVICQVVLNVSFLFQLRLC